MNREFSIVILPKDQMIEKNSRDKNIFIMKRLYEIFLSIGAPNHLNGFGYLVSAIKRSCSDIEILTEITKELYPSVAREYSTTSSRVEQSIRNIIKVIWSNGNLVELEKMFGYRAKHRPCNSEFISMVTDRLLSEYKIYNE